MPEAKASISVAAATLETGAPELGMVDLTELRNVPRPFPKDDVARDCYRFWWSKCKPRPIGLAERKPNARRPADRDFM
jgi:hypothetical protein